MKILLNKVFETCPISGRIKGLKHLQGWQKLILPFMGFLALIWVLLRLIPRPNRATYPCMKVAVPLASGFLAQLVGAVLSLFAFKSARAFLRRSWIAPTFICIAMGLSTTYFVSYASQRNAAVTFATAYHGPNQPIGEAKGIFPGRVVWVYDPAATKDDCDPDEHGHGWFMSENNDVEVIEKMLSDGLQSITGRKSDSLAWDKIFKYFNVNHAKDSVGYQAGEKIFIKTNATSSWGRNFNYRDLSIVFNNSYGISETSPHLVLALLRQLINVYNVPQECIYIGDPMKHIYKHCYDLWYAEFPNLHYMDHDGYAEREKFAKSDSLAIYYSDRGAILRVGTWDNASVGDTVRQDYIYTIFDEVDYVINIPTLKGHKHAGITMFAKNHFGSQTRDDAKHLHGGLVAPEAGNPRRQGYSLYRVQVDLMGNQLLSGKNLIYILDALWTSDDEIGPPVKWQMVPFNGDWTSSVFVSLDPVAIESVGFDFLRTEFTAERRLYTFPQMVGVDDYLHQAADSTNWPEGIIYDPENDGISLPSLGVHEHWDSAQDMQYSRNMGTGNGIELVKIFKNSSSIQPEGKILADKILLRPNYPNPFNASTRITYEVPRENMVILTVYNARGEQVTCLVNQRQAHGEHSVVWDAGNWPSGIYFLQLRVGKSQEIQKCSLIK